MFNNIIYFIVVLVVFSSNYPVKDESETFPYFFSMLFFTWVLFAACCSWGFLNLNRRFFDQRIDRTLLSSSYSRLIFRLSVLAVFLFALDVYLLNLKYWFQMIPVARSLFVVQGIFALILFLFYLSTIWWCAFPVSLSLFGQQITRTSYVLSHIRFNIPLLFPWICLSLIYDIVAISPWAGADGFPIGIAENIIFYALIIILLMIYMPAVIQYCWGCRPLSSSEKAKELESFLQVNGFKYRTLLLWPIFEGRMMTAGIMGVMPRYRYLLVTKSLFSTLTTEELKAVLAHEMGHAKYHHVLLLAIFLIGLMVIISGLEGVLPLIFYLTPFLTKLLANDSPQLNNLILIIQVIPMLIILLVYFRYVMGFFMRNFERQSDLYSAKVMQTPVPTMRSLEKIAYFSGKIRENPNWHHFSIKQRVDCLAKTLDDPNSFRRHNRFLLVSFFVYLVFMGGAAYGLFFSPLKQDLTYHLVAKGLEKQFLEDPDNVSICKKMAMVYHEIGDFDKAIRAYEQVIAAEPDHAVSLNNLAWILVTIPDKAQRDNVRALKLAKRAVSIERSAVFLDTLAEAYYVNGFVDEALVAIKEAIIVAKENRQYYEKQFEKYVSEKP